MLNQSHVYISRQAKQFQQALMQIAQRRQQRSHLSSDLHDGQADALKCPQDQFCRWGGRRARGLTRIESCDFALRFLQLPPDHEFHQNQQSQGQAQQPDQALHPALGLQKQRCQRQGLAFEAPETTFNQILPPISHDHGHQRQHPMISRIDTPPQALLSFFDGLSLDLRTNRALALDSDLGLARAILALVSLPRRGLGFDLDYSRNATALHDLMGGRFQFLGVKEFLALFAFIELAYFSHSLPESLVEVLSLTRSVSHRAHYQPPLLPLHRLAVNLCLQLDTHLIAFGDQPRLFLRFPLRMIDLFESLRAAEDRRQQPFQFL